MVCWNVDRAGKFWPSGKKYIKVVDFALVENSGFSYLGIDHVQLAAPVGCEELARRFYHVIMGLEEMDKPESLKARGGVWFRCGNGQIHIGIELDFRPARKAHPAIYVRNIDKLKERLTTYGVSFKEDELLPGAKRFYVDDPFGNRIEVLEWIN